MDKPAFQLAKLKGIFLEKAPKEPGPAPDPTKISAETKKR